MTVEGILTEMVASCMQFQRNRQGETDELRCFRKKIVYGKSKTELNQLGFQLLELVINNFNDSFDAK